MSFVIPFLLSVVNHLFREFMSYIQRYKSFFSMLPEVLCDNEMVLDEHTCWNGEDVVERYCMIHGPLSWLFFAGCSEVFDWLLIIGLKIVQSFKFYPRRCLLNILESESSVSVRGKATVFQECEAEECCTLICLDNMVSCKLMSFQERKRVVK